MAWFDNWRAARHLRASPYRAALAALTPGLQACWRHDAPYAYPGIPTGAWFFACAAEGLLDFFDAAARSSRPCILPSKAADSVWRIWLRHDAAGLERFCRAHVGAAPTHALPAAPGPGPLSGALLDTLEACARIAGTPPPSPRRPGRPPGHGGLRAAQPGAGRRPRPQRR